MLVAAVAEKVLEAESPKQMAVARAMVGEFSAYFPHTPSFVAAATWSDNIQSQHLRAFANWHFIDWPYLAAGFPVEQFAATENGQVPQQVADALAQDTDNIVWALKQVFAGLKERLMSQWGAALFIRYAIHLMGDLHQPLHTMGRWSLATPRGDRGGNLCKVSVDPRQPPRNNTNFDGITNMHKVFDSAGGRYFYDPFFAGAPFTEQYEAELRAEASRLMALWPAAQLPTFDAAGPVDVMAWSHESFQVAVRDVWLDRNQSGVSTLDISCHGSALPLDYLDHVTAVCQRQIVLAGRRLAQFLRQSLPLYYEAVQPESLGPASTEPPRTVVISQVYRPPPPTAPSASAASPALAHEPPPSSSGMAAGGVVGIALLTFLFGAVCWCAARSLMMDFCSSSKAATTLLGGAAVRRAHPQHEVLLDESYNESSEANSVHTV